MQYISTRGGDERVTFEEAVFRGLAQNGGLFIPERIPSLPEGWEKSWATLSYVELCHRVLSLFIPPTAEEGGIASADLYEIIDRSYSTFRDPQVAPLTHVTEREWCLELWHGPTFAFKDIALQLLGNLFEYFLKRRNEGRAENDKETITVVGATSGDTGSAAIAGLRSKEHIQIFILHPYRRVSAVQNAQMTTVLDENVHNLAVDGTFDDCQDIVKALFGDKTFNDKYKLGAVNSINWARILSQIVYYFYAFFTLKEKEPALDMRTVQYVVPTGNFGDILAGYYAKRLGVPMEILIAATNSNDILQRFWATGRYEKRATHQSSSSQFVSETLSPAMDILVSSNFERLLWYLAHDTDMESSDEAHRAQKAGAQVASSMSKLKTKGAFSVSPEEHKLARHDFVSFRASDEETKETIRKYYAIKRDEGKYLVDPHTAVGFNAANKAAVHEHTTQIILSTAHPAKFRESVLAAVADPRDLPLAENLFDQYVIPPELRGMLELPRRFTRVCVADAPQNAGPTQFDKLLARTKQIIEEQSF
ncbi:threonine synthase [Malassezia vespertilionis]|uniref:Thr4p n=1 Tax=Malassezia vespertilionis TaxID=2020962 RepID=A0A2N1JAS9_9BASI|nr:threonine synthase [Malassezia vespertilionis]PKI83602.1 Thr4p [Malassezia vespertilionis]WFD07465.1 threonine synthase [Malassezia vespertilionis]